MKVGSLALAPLLLAVLSMTCVTISVERAAGRQPVTEARAPDRILPEDLLYGLVEDVLPRPISEEQRSALIAHELLLNSAIEGNASAALEVERLLHAILTREQMDLIEAATWRKGPYLFDPARLSTQLHRRLRGGSSTP